MKIEHRHNIRILSEYCQFRSPKYKISEVIFIFFYFAEDLPYNLCGFARRTNWSGLYIIEKQKSFIRT